MSMTNGELIKAHERTNNARSRMQAAQRMHDICMQLAAHVLALEEHNRLWPIGYTLSKFLELRMEIGLLNASFELLKKEVSIAEKALAEASGLYSEAAALTRLGQSLAIPGTNLTIDDRFDDQIVRNQVAAENTGVLNELYTDHARTVGSLLGI